MLRLSKEAVRACRIHSEAIDEAVERLLAKNVFAFIDIIEAKGLYTMVEAIRWDHIRDIIQETFDKELIPLCALYFKRHSLREEIAYPGKFTAGTGGQKRAVGYAWAGDNTRHLFHHNLIVNQHQIDGKIKRYDAKRTNVINLIGREAVPPAMPQLPLPPVEIKTTAA